MWNKNNIRTTILLMFLLFTANLFMAGISLADTPPPTGKAGIYDKIKTDQLDKLGEIGLPGEGDTQANDVLDRVAKIIKYVLGALVMLFMVLIIYAGFKWMTAGGNEDNINSAKKIMTSAIIGVVVILFSYALTVFIFNILLTKSGS